MNASSLAFDAHPGWKLSRQCIKDVMIAKRTGVIDQGGLMAKLCTFNLRQLRDTQLAPHVETRLIANRYSVRYAIKKYGSLNCSCCWEPFEPNEYIKRADNYNIQALCCNNLFLCRSCLEAVLEEVKQTPGGTIIVYVDGGIVHWLALPSMFPETYLVADADVYKQGDIEECRDYCTRILISERPGMRII